MAMRPGILHNKLNPNTETAHINEDEIDVLLDMVPDGNFKAADFFAQRGGAVVIRLQPVSSSDIELLDAYMAVVARLGEFSGDFSQAFADGDISANEFEQLQADANVVIASLLEMLARVGQMVPAGKRG